jgi:hypothetical protein
MEGAVLRKCVTLLALSVALGVLSVFPMGAARVVEVPCGQDLDARVNADPATTATLFKLRACNYKVDKTVFLKDGDGLAGPVGTFTRRGPAFDPDPLAEITGVNGISEVVAARGQSPATVTLEWISVKGAEVKDRLNGRPEPGTGAGITMGPASNTSTVYAVRSHHNEAAGVLGAHGFFERVELDNNATNNDSVGYNGSGLKARTEVEIKNSYVHDNGGNGLWCDVGCLDASNMANGYWVHDNLVVDNARGGVRYENSSNQALIENNEIHGNSYDAFKGGVSIRDAQNALVRGNVFGAATIAGIDYRANAPKPGAIRASDSGKETRPNLRNVEIKNNVLNGEVIRGCELADEIVACSGNN